MENMSMYSLRDHFHELFLEAQRLESPLENLSSEEKEQTIARVGKEILDRVVIIEASVSKIGFKPSQERYYDIITCGLACIKNEGVSEERLKTKWFTRATEYLEEL